VFYVHAHEAGWVRLGEAGEYKGFRGDSRIWHFRFQISDFTSQI
jgi:hypothetical protein